MGFRVSRVETPLFRQNKSQSQKQDKLTRRTYTSIRRFFKTIQPKKWDVAKQKLPKVVGYYIGKTGLLGTALLTDQKNSIIATKKTAIYEHQISYIGAPEGAGFWIPPWHTTVVYLHYYFWSLISIKGDNIKSKYVYTFDITVKEWYIPRLKYVRTWCFLAKMLLLACLTESGIRGRPFTSNTKL